MTHTLERSPRTGRLGTTLLPLAALLISACSSDGSDPTPVIPPSGSDAGQTTNAAVTPGDAAVVQADAGAASATPDAGAGSSDAGNADAGSTQVSPGGEAGAEDAGDIAPVDGAVDPSSDGSTQVSPDGFPKNEPVNVDQMGPSAFMTYTDGLDNSAYDSAIMYYPTDAPPPYPAVAFSPGFTATKEDYEAFLGPLLASHGIAIMLTTPNSVLDYPDARAEDLKAALEQIKGENTREGSPLKGKLAVERLCVTGQSMGGGGTLWAASSLGHDIRCAVPLQPWQPNQDFAMIVAPTMFIAAEDDTVADVASNAAHFYASIPNSVTKYYVEFAGADHFLTTGDLGIAYDVQSKYMIAFYKTYLEDDMRYHDMVLAAEADPKLSKYEHNP